MTRAEQTLNQHRENIIAMRRGGMSWSSIAATVGVAESSLTHWARANITADELDGAIPPRIGRPPRDGSRPKSQAEAMEILNSRRADIVKWRQNSVPWSDIARELRLNLRRVIAWGHANLPKDLTRQVRPKQRPRERSEVKPETKLPLPKAATPDQQFAALMGGRRYSRAAPNDAGGRRIAKPVNTHTASSVVGG